MASKAQKAPVHDPKESKDVKTQYWRSNWLQPCVQLTGFTWSLNRSEIKEPNSTDHIREKKIQLQYRRQTFTTSNQLQVQIYLKMHNHKWKTKKTAMRTWKSIPNIYPQTLRWELVSHREHTPKDLYLASGICMTRAPPIRKQQHQKIIR